MSWVDSHLTNLVDFLAASPTSYHAVAELSATLTEAGFVQLDETEPWAGKASQPGESNEPGKSNKPALPARGFVVRDGALAAWVSPKQWNAQTGLRVFACHTDSPGLKLKPDGMFDRAGQRMVNVEVYGGPLLHTWFDRDLAIAGRVVDLENNAHLVCTESLAIVPSLAIHLDRSLRSGIEVDAQTDLMAMIDLPRSQTVEQYVANKAGLAAQHLGGADLWFVSTQRPQVFGARGQFLASSRMDNLLSVHAGGVAIANAKQTGDLQVVVAFDHEELGSSTATGAAGPFLPDLLARLADLCGWSVDERVAWVRRGWCLSADVAHGVHPNRSERHDPVVRPRLNGGPMLKWSAAANYGTDAQSAALWRRACDAAGVMDQVFVNNNNVPGGASLGPLLATRCGIRTVDCGTGLLAMHSVRETCGTRDPELLTKVASAFLGGA